jgi:outer membrane protein insertion porin family
MKFYKKTAFILGFLFIISPVFASSAFLVRQISFQGLHKVTPETALHYLPFRAGKTFTTEDSARIIAALYKTGFFTDVEIFRDNNTLMIKVQERPTIAELTFTGNKTITNEKLTPVLKNLKLAVGGFYDPAILNELKQGLQGQYGNMGFYAVDVTVVVKDLPRNRVAITVHVAEGKLAKVAKINFTGNHAFSSRTLQEQMKLKATGLFSWFTQDNRYSEYALNQDIQAIQTYYLNHGYLEFHVAAQEVVEAPKNHATRITLHLSEGPLYHISGFEVQAPYGDDPGVQKLMKHLKIGSVFSRDEVLDFSKAIAHVYADKGFAFSKAEVMPRINQQNHTVYLVFTLTKGRRVHVRRINIVGNDRTLDTVLRTRLLQMEASPYSYSRVEGSKQELQMLSYVKDITIDTKPVADDLEAVDLDYHVKEFNSGRASVNAGWSDVEGFMYGANIVEPNFLGTGRAASIGFTNSQLTSNYSISYTNPFYTISGISRSISVYYNHTKPSRRINLAPYTVDDFGGSVSYGMPVGLHDGFNVGYGYDFISVSNIQQVYAPNVQSVATNGIGPAAPSVLQFLAKTRSPFSQFNLLAGWSHVTLNRGIFPTAGNSQSLNATLGAKIINRSAGYYKLTYDGKWYLPVGFGVIVEPHADLGFGSGLGSGIDGALPFYNNFFAGGIETLPGFSPSSLGPYNTNSPWQCAFAVNGGTGNCNRIGGNVEVLGGINFIFPNPFGERFRTAFFVDAGNVFDTYKAQYTQAQRLINPQLLPLPYESIALKNLRVSAGLMVSWWSPMGPIEVALGFPIQRKKSDNTQIFGFTFGASI